MGLIVKAVILLLSLLCGKPEVTQDPPKPTAGSVVFLSIAGEKVVKVSAICSRDDVLCRAFQEVGGRWVVITQAPTTGGLTVILAAVDGEGLHHWKHVVVAGPAPPGPGPTPDQSRFKLDQAAKTHLSAVTAKNRAADVAAVYRGVASSVAAGALNDPDAIAAVVAQQAAATLGNDFSAWKPWATLMAKEIDKLEKAGSLKLPADYREALEEIAKGLTT